MMVSKFRNMYAWNRAERGVEDVVALLPFSISCPRAACCLANLLKLASSFARTLLRNAGSILVNPYGANTQQIIYTALRPSAGSLPDSPSTCTISQYSSPSVRFPIRVVNPRYNSSEKTRVSEV